MKFSELKQNLNNGVKNAYYCVGKDAFLRDSAEKMITKRCVNNFFELNVQKFNNENFESQKFLDSLLIAPFGADRRVVVLNEITLSSTDIKKAIEVLQNNDYICLIIKLAEDKTNMKKLIETGELVDCSPLDEFMLKTLIANKFSKAGIKIDSYSVQMLIDFCNCDMTFLEQECQKLISYAIDTKKIGENDIKNLVHKNIEYSVFELSNAVAEKDAEKAIMLLDIMLENKESPQNLLVLLLANFRKLFYVSVSKMTEGEMASYLKVKEYSIKISKRLALKFTPKKLKQILDIGGKIDFDIKNNKLDDKNALYYFVSNIVSL